MISSILYDRAEGYFDDDGRQLDGGYYEKREYATYAEYGLTDRVTLVGRIAWQDVALVEAGIPDSAQGFAASEAGARLLIWRSEPAVLSVQLSGILPGGGENIADRPLGDGGLGAEVRVLAGMAAGDAVFLEAQPAYRWRDDGYLDEARLDLTAGWRPRADMTVMVQSFSTWSVSDPSTGQRHFSQHKVQASFGISTRFGEFHVGGWFTPSGRNAIDERAVFAAVWQRF